MLVATPNAVVYVLVVITKADTEMKHTLIHAHAVM